jgi:regulator of replication initiation timing
MESMEMANASLEKVAEMAEELEFKNKYYLNEIQKLADEITASERGIGKCKEAMEEEFKNECLEEIKNLSVTKEDLEAEIIELNEILDKTLAKNRELEIENEDLVQEVGSIIAEENHARRSYTALQISVSILIFLYGMAYGRFFRC